jgi:hypothetical protein
VTREKNVKGAFRRDGRAFARLMSGGSRPEERFTETLPAVDDWTRSFGRRAREGASNLANPAVVDNCGKVDNL